MFRDSQIELSEEQINHYQENGFVQVDTVISSDEVEELRTYLDEVMNNESERSVQNSKKGAAYYKVLNQRVNTWRDHGGMAKFVLSERLAGMANQLIGHKGIRLFHDHALLKMPLDSKETPWHQDYPYWPMKEPGALSIWLTLDDVDEQNGCMKFLPKTHKLKDLKAVDLVNSHDIFDDAKTKGQLLDKDRAVTVPLKAGSCTFHDGLTFHAAYSNQTDKPRRVLAIIFMPDGTIYSGKSHPVVDGLNIEKGEALTGGTFPKLA
ncbi:phytanoyl-CoA dioxygenase family protein [Gracilibacillus sp. YIM 98692]|uniref:phytanoyl-CoA dioxygenase family protein n=1 Tax=Gracilibacillus sp. YIM 98692 TaxID=2663532 RepID=UPI0013D4B2C2|nr:phytanoyl-CoA dioxygenase family protein [Gracilibacillus sp. YIM 98692]